MSKLQKVKQLIWTTSQRYSPFMLHYGVLALITTGLSIFIEKVILFPYVARTVGLEVLGSFIVTRNWIVIIATFSIDGFGTIYLRKQAKYIPSDRSKLLVQLFYKGLLIVILLFGSFWILMTFKGIAVIGDVANRSFVLMIFYGVFLYAALMTITYFRAELRLTEFYLLRLVLACLALIAIPLLSIWPNLALPLAYLGSAVLIFFVSAWLFYTSGHVSLWPLNTLRRGWKIELGQAIQFGIPGTLVIISQFLDKQVAGVMFGSIGAGQYYSVVNLAQVITFPLETAGGIFLPYLIASRRDASKRIAVRYVFLIGLLLSLAVAFPFSLIGPFVLDFLYGVGTYSLASSLFYISIVTSVLRGLSSLLMCYIVAFHSPRTLLLINLISPLIGPVLMLWLGKLLGLEGIAFGNLFLNILLLVVLLSTIWKLKPGVEG